MSSAHYAMFDAPDLAPIIVCERTALGWRGVSEDGEILDVKGHNSTPVTIPESVAITYNDRPIGYRKVTDKLSTGVIDGYLERFNLAVALMRDNENAAALAAINAAIDMAPTLRARFNRALILLALGRWHEGFAEFEDCERSPVFERPSSRAALDAGIPRWQGEDIAGKRLLLVHDHGFGDTIMTLRYVPRLQGMGADVVLWNMPPELRRLAVQCGPVVTSIPGPPSGDYFCTMLGLPRALGETPDSVPIEPYLKVQPELVDKWRGRLNGKHKRIGIAWSVGKVHDGDYPRALPLSLLTKALGGDAELISVQQQGAAEADMFGVRHFRFEDFADCAALMSLCDEIVTIDTAALHLAGAIGHPRITALLSHWASWRWLSPLYQNVAFCRQDAPGDWVSALAKRKR